MKLGIVADGQPRGYSKSKVSGYMDLVVERVEMLDNFNGQDCKAISLAHYFEQNGDLCQDPEMVVLIYPESKIAEAFSFQQAIPPVYQEVYPEPGKFYLRLKNDLNSFLRQWLNNLIHQGHGKEWI